VCWLSLNGHLNQRQPQSVVIKRMDKVSASVRSKNMAAIRGKDTKPERIVRTGLFSEGFRYRLHRRDLPGCPDIVLPKHNAVIFVQGCFWHMHSGCSDFRFPSSNSAFWKLKLEGNVVRDRAAVKELLLQGWRVMSIWECSLKGERNRRRTMATLISWLRSRRKVGSSKLTRPSKSR
jgi:DNA mismatch endonuclease (patch repair protein)